MIFYEETKSVAFHRAKSIFPVHFVERSVILIYYEVAMLYFLTEY